MMKILVVEASHDVRAQVVHALSAVDELVVQGAVPHLAGALRAFEAAAFDGVVTGGEMPDGEVVDLIVAARRRQVPTVVVYAPGVTSPERRGLLAAGASDVIDGSARELAEAVLELDRVRTLVATRARPAPSGAPQLV
jgi:DNA-binding NarL/FixJ family response regulator